MNLKMQILNSVGLGETWVRFFSNKQQVDADALGL